MPVAKQDTCPICAAPFKKGQLVIQYKQWGSETEKSAHGYCVAVTSKGELGREKEGK